LENDSAALVIDFKENLKLNYKPNETSHSYYDAPLRTCFGAILKYKKEDKVYELPIDIFSKILSHQTWFVIQTLDYIFENVLRKIGIKKVSIFMDNAKHFRSKELCAGLIKLGEKFNTIMNWSYLVNITGNQFVIFVFLSFQSV
jgi:hypothetical protein